MERLQIWDEKEKERWNTKNLNLKVNSIIQAKEKVANELTVKKITVEEERKSREKKIFEKQKEKQEELEKEMIRRRRNIERTNRKVTYESKPH